MHVILFRMQFKKSFSKNLKFMYTKESNDLYQILGVQGDALVGADISGLIEETNSMQNNARRPIIISEY